MIFSDLYKSPRLPFSKLRSAHPHGVAVPSDLDADLISKDKAKQKEAVRRFLTEKIRTDWDFSWPSVTDSPPTPLNKKEDEHSSPAPTANDPTTSAPDVVPSTVDAVGGLGVIPVTVTVPAPPLTAADEEGIPRDPGEEADSESDAESVYSTISEDAAHYRARAEWTSDLSDDEAPRQDASPFRFDNPDSVGTTVQSLIITRQALRRRAVREEVAWNKGLACFEARRNAWTGAKTVRVKPKQPVPVPPASPRRLFRRHHRTESLPSPAFSAGSPPAASSPLSPISTHNSQQLDGMAITPPPSESDSAHSGSLSKSTTASGVHRTSSQESSPHILYPVETLIPIPPPLLPAQNPMRASVTPNIYPSLYDKIVVHSLQPSCPVNLGDMLRACVVGWKRDGEWPPRAPVQPMPTASEMAAMRRRKAQQQYQQQKQHVRKDSSATVGSSRRLSFGIFGGGSKTEKVNEEKESKENNSDETAGKGIRRSLLRVFSHGHSSQSTSGAVLSPTSPTTVASPTLPINEVVTPILA
ncbi:hypothetical protein B0H63DRAFT_154285 [Podospora didyma]|uniref:Gag1-like clamp domain-containing protein n=1 Tax=Podospora didyma TaxID=330526 RepID=A0AAE0U1L4_9PEZI|nr:hypothetical protein B0H63DRAFT_154285 [Podospora didyma]